MENLHWFSCRRLGAARGDYTRKPCARATRRYDRDDPPAPRRDLDRAPGSRTRFPDGARGRARRCEGDRQRGRLGADSKGGAHEQHVTGHAPDGRRDAERREIGLPFVELEQLCAARAVRRWLDAAGIERGTGFSSVQARSTGFARRRSLAATSRGS